jgi:NitT/TauT family transport system substrate-binding protein
MKRLDFIALAAAAMIGSASYGAHAQEKLTVRLDFSPWGFQAAMHLAKEKGWFADAGLDVDIQEAGRWSHVDSRLGIARR